MLNSTDYIQPAFILTSISDNQMLLFTYLILHSRHVHLLLQGCFFVLFFSEIAILYEPSATSDLGIHCLLRTLALCFIEPMEIQALQACGYYYYYYYFFFFFFFFIVRHLTKPVTGQGSPPERACHHIKRNFTIKL